MQPAEVYPDPDGELSARAPDREFAITQVSVVVRDLDATMRAYHEAFGWGPWRIFQSDGDVIMHDCTIDGKPCESFNLRWAEVQVGVFQLRAAPAAGRQQSVQRMLNAHGEGIGSIAVMFTTEGESEQVKQEFRDAGIDVTASGRIGDHVAWYYLDTEPAFKCVIESGSGHAIDFRSRPRTCLS